MNWLDDDIFDKRCEELKEGEQVPTTLPLYCWIMNLSEDDLTAYDILKYNNYIYITLFL